MAPFIWKVRLTVHNAHWEILTLPSAASDPHAVKELAKLIPDEPEAPAAEAAVALEESKGADLDEEIDIIPPGSLNEPTGAVSASVLRTYLGWCTSFGVSAGPQLSKIILIIKVHQVYGLLASVIVLRIFSVGTNVWLQRWTEANAEAGVHELAFWLGGYVALGLFASIMVVVVGYFALSICGDRKSVV